MEGKGNAKKFWCVPYNGGKLWFYHPSGVGFGFTSLSLEEAKAVRDKLDKAIKEITACWEKKKG